MNERISKSNRSFNATWFRRAGRIVASGALALGLAHIALAQTPVYNAPVDQAPIPPGGAAAPYSWTEYHGGGAINFFNQGAAPNINNFPYSGLTPFGPTANPAINPLTFPYTNPALYPPYGMLQGTPSGAVQTSAAGVTPPTYQYTQIFSQVLGNWNPDSPPGGIVGGGVVNPPNHFNDGPDFGNHFYFVSGPLGFNSPLTGGGDVEGSPVAINATEFPEIADMFYVGEQTAETDATSNGNAGDGHGINPTQPLSATNPAPADEIRQVVYFGRTEPVTVGIDPVTGVLSAGGVPLSQMTEVNGTQTIASANIEAGTQINVGAVYAMDGFTGDIIWRYQMPSFTISTTPSTTVASQTVNSLAGNFTGLAVPTSSTNYVGSVPFDVGPEPTGGTSVTTTSGTFSVTSASLFGLPFSSLNISIQASSVTTNAAGTLSTYTGTFQIYAPPGDTTTYDSVNNPLLSGTFTMNETINGTNESAPVAGTFTPTGGGDYVYDGTDDFPAFGFTGTMQLAANNEIESLTGSINAPETLRQSGVFSSLAVARVALNPASIPVTESPALGANADSRLVVFATDDNGYVYCLDALGNGYWNKDTLAESNNNDLKTASGVANTTTGVNYDYTDLWSNPQILPNTATAHIGTTFPYWIYRPDPSSHLLADGTTDTSPTTDDDLPVPEPYATTNQHNRAAPIVSPDGTLLYYANSNGVLYALSTAGGQVTEDTTETGTANPVNPADVYNASIPAEPGIDDLTPTTTVKWWDTFNNSDPDATSNTQTIQSAPAIYQPNPQDPTSDPTVYVATSSTTAGASAGQVWAVDGVTGPTTNLVPGSTNYNVQNEGLWVFPKTASLIGNITGSPVVFTNPDTGLTQVYFAADTAQETVATTNPTTGAATTTLYPASEDTGRVWSVDAVTGAFDWVYPGAATGTGDPDSTTANVYNAPIEGFEYATPAVGMVQFPTAIQYVNTAGATVSFTQADAVHADVKGNNIPMLYIGTTQPEQTTDTGLGPAEYYINLDGNTDATRLIYRLNAPNGSNLDSSPILVVNPSTAGGNGGVIFFTASNTDGTYSVYEYQATPSSNDNPLTGTPVPDGGSDGYILPNGGAISAPCVAAASINDVNTLGGTNSGVTLGTTFYPQTVTDWVYVGDSATGQCFGYTPEGYGPNDQTNGFEPYISPTGNSALLSNANALTFPLRGFVYTSSTNAASTDMNTAKPYGTGNLATSPLPVVEWGQNLYIRVANVVPPLPISPSTGDTETTPDITIPTSYVETDIPNPNATDPTYPNYYLGAGSAINVSLATVDAAGQTTTPNILPLTIPQVMYEPQTPTTTPNLVDGFYERTDTGTQSTIFGNTSELGPVSPTDEAPQPAPFDTYRYPETELLDGNGLGIAASAVYSVSYASTLDPNGANPLRRNTPGPTRTLYNVSQTAQVYTCDGTTFTAVPDGKVNLSLTATPDFSYPSNAPVSTDTTVASNAAANGVTSTGSAYIDQPTFGMLNPLAVRGAGVDLTSNTPTADPTTNLDGIGPFRGISNTAALTATDLQALAQGNLVPQNEPASGVLSDIPTTSGGSVTQNGQSTAAAAQFLDTNPLTIITTTPDILDGTTGDNTDPNAAPGQVASTGNLTNVGDASGLANALNFGMSLLDVGDRSQLGTPDGPVLVGAPAAAITVKVTSASLGWQDNTPTTAPTTYDSAGQELSGPGGADARINPLPWEDVPAVNLNGSVDYPNIPRGDLALDLAGTSTDLNNTALPGDTLPVGTPAIDRTIYPASVSTNVDVPKYQPANLQIWENVPNGTGVGAGITPSQINTGDYNFAMGYAATLQVTGSTGTTFNPRDASLPYRTFSVYTGVPVDIKTVMNNPVTDVGVEPAGFGEQMNDFPYNPNNGLFNTAGTTLGEFTPYSPYNTSMVTGAVAPFTYPYVGYAGHFLPLDIVNNSNVNLLNPHLDQEINTVTTNGATTSSLPLLSDATASNDDDLYSYIPAYDFDGVSGPAGTTSPFIVRSTLDTDLAEGLGISPLMASYSDAAYYPTITFHKPRVGDTTGTTMTIPDVPHGYTGTTGGAPMLDQAGTAPYQPATPYVGVEVPYGTPVGTYAQNLRLFEGYDTAYEGDDEPYNALIGPTYDGNPGGYGPFNPANLQAFNLGYSATTGAPIGLQAYSDPATQLKVTVEEDQMTNGFSQGALPMFDSAFAGSGSTSANFAPSAYRDPTSGNLNLYWTSSRDYTGGIPPQYNTYGANLLFNTSTPAGYFEPASGTQWWAPISGFPFSATTPASNNTDWGVALTQGTLSSGDGYGPSGAADAYGFGVNISSTPPYTSSIGCFTLTSATGAPIGNPVTVASSAQPMSDVTGLSFASGITFNNPDSGQNGSAATLSENLWAFWTGGNRGNTALYYSNTNAAGATPGVFSPPSVLPVPAGIVAVSHASAVLTNAPITESATGQDMPVIEVTYSGTGPSGATNVYLSRYRPYQPSATSGALLGLVPMPSVDEEMEPAPGSNWWQGQDVGWERGNDLQIGVEVTNNGTQVTDVIKESGPTTFTEYVNGTQIAVPNAQITYDRASGLLVFTNAALPLANGTGLTQEAGQSIYVDPSGGRVRFSINLPIASPDIQSLKATPGAFTTVTALVSPTARRITTSRSTDTGPVAFLDQSYEPNESGVTSDPAIQADRYWFLWHRVGASSAKPSIWYKTQRLTVAVTDAGLPVGIAVTSGGYPNVTVKLGATTLYTPGGGNANVLDVDATRGRIYFPVVYAGTAMEGQNVTITGVDADGNNIDQTANIGWADEPQYNDTGSQTAAGAVQALANDGYEVPMNTVVNESGISAFLDPRAYSGNNLSNALGFPHKVWLFWTSTRNGTSDIYNEVINPRFSAAAETTGAP